MSAADWTPERIAELARLLDEKLTASEAAKALGVTRNAVIGKAKRLGLRLQSGQTHQRTPKSNYRPGAFKAPRATLRPPRPEPKPTSPPPVDVSHAKPWTERVFGECNWPVSGEGADTFYCCAPVKGERTWCAAHCAIGFQPASAKSPREMWRSVRRAA